MYLRMPERVFIAQDARVEADHVVELLSPVWRLLRHHSGGVNTATEECFTWIDRSCVMIDGEPCPKVGVSLQFLFQLAFPHIDDIVATLMQLDELVLRQLAPKVLCLVIKIEN